MSTAPLTLVPKVWDDEPLKPRRERLWLAGEKVCYWCKCPTRLVDGFAWDIATTDHVIPRYKGGVNEDSNCVSACNLCNNRRSHEDARGLPDGSLLGKYRVGPDGKPITGSKSKYKCLTGDDKKALMAKMDKQPFVNMSTEDLVREQRDQALKRISSLNNEVAFWKTSSERFRAMSVMEFLRHKLSIKLAVQGC